MDKNMPKMYKNKINKRIDNVQRVYSSIDGNGDNFRESVKLSSKSLKKKIDDIFNSYNYVYKADVVIVTDSDRLKARIIGRDNDNLITIDSEYIPISIIRDIYKELWNAS